MGKIAKGSRKGKKAWRANISTEDIEDFFEQSNKDALSGGSLSQLPNDSLFYVDNSKDLSVKRKIEKHREKVLRCDSVLQKNPFVQALPSAKPKQKKKSKKENKDVVKEKDETRDGQKNDGASASGMVDIWANEGEGDNPKKVPKPSVIPAVEVEASGCSYNPTFESHQESLAQAVAEEMQKVYRKELGPEPVPITVPGEVINDEDHILTIASSPICSLPNIIEEITKEDEEKQKRHIRRVVAMQERLKVRPPRLGKHKFEPAPTQVLLSEEITGSLRKLKGCCTLVKDRFKSLEKRGLIVPVKGKRLDELSTLLLLFLSLVVAILLIRVTVDYLKQRL
ncbi:Ribosome biogenesis protein NOP53 [Citrus sinensis]|uniref:Ribosome biogenesis protein NOP53 n=1 Tax=Citrus sinensis TaxID=2711 RepID=A0ACB8L1V7_CITSI|nr:Ribosome biogenesis protein NOP53 [Citrus sinensis]